MHFNDAIADFRKEAGPNSAHLCTGAHAWYFDQQNKSRLQEVAKSELE